MSAALIVAATLSTIQLRSPVDEPELYCLDVSGWGENLIWKILCRRTRAKANKGRIRYFTSTAKKSDSVTVHAVSKLHLHEHPCLARH